MGIIADQKLEKKLHKLKARLEKKYIIERFILFGSRARGDYLKTSDVDLIIVSRDFQGVRFLDRIRAVASLWDDDLLLQPLCYTTEELEEKSGQVGTIRAALQEGIEL